MSGPLVSIVIPAYNHARYLKQALDSVLAQSYPAVELIVLDDGSTDGTRGILAKYGERFRWETQANMGQAATLNKGWSMARGDLLGYLSADDYLHPDAVKGAVECLGRHGDAVLAYPDFVQVDSHSRPLRTIRAPEFSYAEMMLKGVCAPGPGTFFRRSAYSRTAGWNVALRRVPDLEYWLRLGLIGRFQRIAQELAFYRVHAGAQSFSATDEAGADEIVAVIDALLAQPALPEQLRERGCEAKANALLMAARIHLLSGRFAQGLVRAAVAFRADPMAAVRSRSYRLLVGGLLGLLGRLRLAAAD
jgi:glycosyltransferase involved in cell wall biosynthesis